MAVAQMPRDPWSNLSGPRLPRKLPTVAIATCWHCGTEGSTVRLPHRRTLRFLGLSMGGKTIGWIPVCRECLGEIPRLDPDPLDVTTAA